MPSIHRPGSTRVAPLELFYDLVFVVIIQQLSRRAETASEPADWLAIGGLTAAIWLCWINQLLLMNQVPARSAREVVLVLVAMAGLGVIAVSLGPEGWDSRLFVLGYVVARTALWPQWSRTRIRQGVHRPFIFGPVLAVLWLTTLTLPPPLMICAWVLLLAIEVSILVTGLPSAAHDAPHLSERAGLFILILLGDCVAETVLALAPTSHPQAWVVAGTCFLTTSLLWVVYFVLAPSLLGRPTSRAAPGYVRDVILVGHLLFVLGLLLLAAGFGAAVAHAVAPAAISSVRAGLFVGTVLILLALAVMSARAIRSLREVPVWCLALAAVALVPLLPLPPVEGLPAITLAVGAAGVQVTLALVLLRALHRAQQARNDLSDESRPFRE